MPTKLLSFIVVFLSGMILPRLAGIAQSLPKKVIMVEIRFGSGIPIEFNDRIHCRFSCGAKPIYDTLVVKESYYQHERKGTEAILYIDASDLPNGKPLKITGEFNLTVNYDPKGVVGSKDFYVDLSAAHAIALGANAYKLTYSFSFGDPEAFTLATMIEYLNDKLNGSNTKNDGYAEIVTNLRTFKSDYYDDKRVKFETLIDFYKLMVFLKDYAEENSFFNQEGGKLAKHISDLNYEVAHPDTSTSKGTYVGPGAALASNDNGLSTADDLAQSNLVYQEYLSASAAVKVMYAQLQLILFLKSR